MSLDESKYLRPEEVETLIEHVEDSATVARARGRWLPVRDECMIKLALWGGLRASELASLQVEDIRLGRDARVRVRDGKGGKDRTVQLPSQAYGFLREYLEALERYTGDENGPLFPGQGGSSISRVTAWRRWKKALEGAGLPPRKLHAARHTAGTLLYRSTGDLRRVQHHLGHARIGTTAIYAHPSEEDIQEGLDAAWA